LFTGNNNNNYYYNNYYYIIIIFTIQNCVIKSKHNTYLYYDLLKIVHFTANKIIVLHSLYALFKEKIK